MYIEIDWSRVTLVVRGGWRCRGRGWSGGVRDLCLGYGQLGLGLSEAVRGFQGLSGTVRGFLGLSGAFRGCQELSGAVRSFLGLSGDIMVRLDGLRSIYIVTAYMYSMILIYYIIYIKGFIFNS